MLKKGPSKDNYDIFDYAGLKPDNMQWAIGAFAVASVHRKPKQVWQIFAGQGKSRIIAAAATYALTEKDVPNVHFVYPTAHLKVRDKGSYAN